MPDDGPDRALPITDPSTVDLALGVLLADGAADVDEARRLLDQAAEREGRTHADMAGAVIGREGRTRSPGSGAHADVATAVATAPQGARLHVITALAVWRVPGADGSSITLLSRGRFASVAATDDGALRADRLQHELGQGPCVGTIEDGASQVAINLAADMRWPQLAARARTELGVSGILSFPLASAPADGGLACLNIYSRQPDGYEQESVAAGTLLAAQASSALVAARHRQVTQLEQALAANQSIGVAIGLLMRRQKVTSERAFTMLRLVSQHRNRKLYDVARDVIDLGELPLD